jgi:hypothetical protein
MKTVTDFKGNTYALDQVVAVLKGGTPHTDLPIPRVPMAVLIYVSGARVDTLVPFTAALAAWGSPTAPASLPAGAAAPGMIDAPAGVADAEAGERA